ncbi:MAG: glycoside hydrolase family 3 N-terminal domain-containing protein [Saprospiraceae bacterium]
MPFRFLVLLLCFFQLAQAQKQNLSSHWVDSVFNSMSFDQKLGQLFMIRAHSNKDSAYEEMVAQQIRDYHVGGLCFFQGTPEKQAQLTNYYQDISSRLPLFIAMDAEHGLGMRLMESTISFPRSLALGGLQDNRMLYDMGVSVAKQCKRLGVNINFAPVTDINNNALNPVIGLRSFGEDATNVIKKSYQYMMGLQDNGVMACMKHFPGHGDTDVDSHYDLPLICHGRVQLDSLELAPFRALSQHGVQSVMVAHLNVPCLDTTANLPTTLSRFVVTDLLRKDIGFQGLAFTDGMEMKGVVKYFKDGDAEAMALAAGNDIILLPENIHQAFAKIKIYLQDKRIDSAQIFQSVKRVLAAKYTLHLNVPNKKIVVNNITRDLNLPEDLSLNRRLIANALTTVRNQDNLIPIRNLTGIATLSIGKGESTVFQSVLDQFGEMKHFYLSKNASDTAVKSMLQVLSKEDLVVLSLHDLNQKPKSNFGVSPQMIELATSLAAKTKVILVVFGTPYILKFFDNNPCVLEAYEDTPTYQELAAMAIMGASGTNGRLPITASSKNSLGDGLTTPSLGRLGYDLPESVGLSTVKLKKIDELCEDLISKGAAPGCVVLVAKNSKIIYNKAFGYHTYERLHATSVDDVFDLASVTKISATTLTLMKLQGAGLIDMAQPMSKYLPDLKRTNKSHLLLEEIYTHTAGLQAWLKFYEKTLDHSGGKIKASSDYYSKTASAEFPIPIAANMFLKKDYDKQIYKEIIQSELRPNKDYKYSDLGLILSTKMIRRLTGKTLDQYTKDNFYRPMGMKTTGFQAWKSIPIERIPPTEEDTYFRMGRIQGYVHDMASAMLGGISGHAGLFSNASDLAKLYQMLLNGGAYAGVQYLNSDVVQRFTTRQQGSSRRGLGFDMKELDATKTQTVATAVSELAFGHTGFTGICVWADPKYNLIYIFLSNRTFPTMENNRLTNMDYRIKIQQAIYDAMH